MFSEPYKPSLYLKDQSNPELEEWLKNNKPTVLKAGESLGTVKFSDARKFLSCLHGSELGGLIDDQ